MSESNAARWQLTLEELARGVEVDEATILAFVRGDLVEGRARQVEDLVSYGEAWDTLLERAHGLTPQGTETLLGLAASVPPGDPMRGLVALLRAALPGPSLEARVKGLLASSEPHLQRGGQALRYGLQMV